MTMTTMAGKAAGQTRIPPRQFPTTGFQRIDASEQVEEERLPTYRRDNYYPVRIGDVLRGRYQVVAKLGYGVTSTVWLCRDLTYVPLLLLLPSIDRGSADARLRKRRRQDKTFWALKIYVRNLVHNQELAVFQYLAGLRADHPGRAGPEPGSRGGNLLIALQDGGGDMLASIEEDEMNEPSARKQTDDTVVYCSRYMLSGAGALTICDFGQARIGREGQQQQQQQQHTGPAMPVVYRAPEVILGMPWGPPVDMWSVALMAWDMLEPKGLFERYDEASQERNDAHHLAAMTALLGAPPPGFLGRSAETKKYWDAAGNWTGPVPLPASRTLASLVTQLAGEDKEKFVSFMEYLLGWDPDERLNAGQALTHYWLDEGGGGGGGGGARYNIGRESFKSRADTEVIYSIS
ncbi:protein kinase-like protein [Niveomyces insectorum RCEF 264]|uniref:non-specific serine/threonine protein kinase n=1 Tax=Niveomyces insectorum RCEF 264 TaxID=1081102 RepID=A0A167XW22_9HYPO|nr:protein kinase-like protein [Niveomyces insectorum RCEF 264]